MRAAPVLGTQPHEEESAGEEDEDDEGGGVRCDDAGSASVGSVAVVG